jgi:hypothetical protein
MGPQKKLWYYCSNNGDGSVTVNFCRSAEEAVEIDEAQEEGWGESSVGYANLSIEDGKLYLEKMVFNPSGMKTEKIEVK